MKLICMQYLLKQTIYFRYLESIFIKYRVTYAANFMYIAFKNFPKLPH